MLRFSVPCKVQQHYDFFCCHFTVPGRNIGEKLGSAGSRQVDLEMCWVTEGLTPTPIPFVCAPKHVHYGAKSLNVKRSVSTLSCFFHSFIFFFGCHCSCLCCLRQSSFRSVALDGRGGEGFVCLCQRALFFGFGMIEFLLSPCFAD